MPNPLLKTGCYFIRFTPYTPPAGVRHYDGVLRVTREDEDGKLVPEEDWSDADIIKVSADLYQHYLDPDDDPKGEEKFGDETEAPTGIPFFPRKNYVYYLRGVEVATAEPWAKVSQVMMRFESRQYDQTARSFKQVGDVAMLLEERDGHLFGTLSSEPSGEVLGTVQANRVSDSVRAAQVEIDATENIPIPNDDLTSAASAYMRWRLAFKPAGWEVTVSSTVGILVPDDRKWTIAELHQAMLLWRSTIDLDQETSWRYYMLCVNQIDGYERGVSFDWGVDADNVPDQVVALTANWRFADDDLWGGWRTKRLRETTGYFRTAVHEFGHAAGLNHNHADNGFMNTTDVIALNGQPTPSHPNPKPFPEDIVWAYHPLDLARLRHAPDPVVRPDMIYSGGDLVAPDNSSSPPTTGLVFHVSSLIDAVPLGAPVRVEYRLENATTDPIRVPNQPSLKSGHILGVVVDPRGQHLPFKPVGLRLDNEATLPLAPGAKTDTHSLTLIAGQEGPLFRIPGEHSVHVRMEWHDADTGKDYQVWGMTRVTVAATQDPQQRLAALRILSTRQVLLSVAIGGDHLVDGQKAVDSALDNPVLAPHYAIVESKRLMAPFQPFRKEKAADESEGWKIVPYGEPRDAEVARALELIQPDTILAVDEIERLAVLMGRVSADDRRENQEEFDRVIRLLLQRLRLAIAEGRIGAADGAIKAVEALIPEDPEECSSRRLRRISPSPEPGPKS